MRAVLHFCGLVSFFWSGIHRSSETSCGVGSKCVLGPSALASVDPADVFFLAHAHRATDS